MVNWNNLDTVGSYKELSEVKKVNLAEVIFDGFIELLLLNLITSLT